jgi:hypothetical protein
MYRKFGEIKWVFRGALKIDASDSFYGEVLKVDGNAM